MYLNRPIGCDLSKGDYLFRGIKEFPGVVPLKSLLAGVGVDEAITPFSEVPISIVSTGDELTKPGETLKPGKIYDSNTTMLKELLKQFGFTNISSSTSSDT